MNSLKPLDEKEKRNIRGLLERNTEELPNGCLEWTAGYSAGYPSLWTGFRQMAGHRAVVALYEDLLKGSVVRHLCHNKRCLNVAHLRQGTYQENSKDESLKQYQTKEPLYKEAAVLVKEGYSIMSACYRVGLSYSQLSRRIINEIIS